VKEIQHTESPALQNTPGEGETFCTAAEICPANKSCRKKPNAGRDGLKACMKGLHAFKLAPQLSFAHPKLPPQLSS